MCVPARLKLLVARAGRIRINRFSEQLQEELFPKHSYGECRRRKPCIVVPLLSTPSPV
jgi:hypothetical protein